MKKLRLREKYSHLDLAYLKESLVTNGRTGNQFLRFSLVGSSGVVVNLVVYTLAIYAFHLHYLPAATLSFLVAMTNNFLLNRHWTFKTHRIVRPGLRRPVLQVFSGHLLRLWGQHGPALGFY